MKRSHRRGLTLTEAVLTVAIFGIFALAFPLAMRIMNLIKYQQQMALMNAQAEVVMNQINHDIRNASYLKSWYEPTATDQTQNEPDRLDIYTFNFKRWSPNDPQLFDRTDTVTIPPNTNNVGINAISKLEKRFNNYTAIRYEIGRDAKGKPVLLRTLWEPTYFTAQGQETHVAGKSEQMLNGLVVPSVKAFNGTEATFRGSSDGVSQSVTVLLRLKSSYQKEADSPRSFTSIVTMRSTPAR